MGTPIKEYRYGKVKGTVWENDYQGKKTYSTSFQKSYMQNGEWKNSTFFTSTDVRDLHILTGEMVNNGVKIQPIQKSKEVPPPAEPAVADIDLSNEDIPF